MTTISWRVRVLFTGLLGLGLAACGNSTPIVAVPLKVCLTGDTTPVQAGPALQINVLSNRADLISGGDALVEIVPPQGATADGLTVNAGDRNVSDQFGLTENGRLLGVVTDLPLGNNVLSAQLPGGAGGSITLTNHLIGGPIFSGPHLPWTCETEGNGLGPATDEDCNAPTVYSYQYKPTGSTTLAAYNPDSPPADVDTTTTDEGNTVPYIVRTEKGAMNRGIYQVAVLYDPSKPWTPCNPQPGWNGKLLYVFGASSGTQYRQASPASVNETLELSRGYAVANSSLNINGNQANHVLAAETMMMLKEHIIETYGPIRYTMGKGCSGASIQQQRIGNAYPGLLQGIQPNCSYPDTWTVRMEVGDCVLFNNYFQNISPGLWGDVAHRAAVTGYQTSSSCLAWEALFGANGNPARTCGLPAEQHYHPQNNPNGVRCSTSDYEINLWGERPASVWGPVEQQIGHGFAKIVYNNIGIEYGRNAVRDGDITPEQFVDLNEKIGGKDEDWVIIPNRTDADPGSVAIAYRAGLVNDFSQLDKVAIIDLRGTSNNEIHTDFHSHEHRERLDRANGHHNNQIIWKFPSSIVIPPPIDDTAFFLLDRWLAAIETDSAAGTLEEKVVRNKPSDAVDQCWTDAGESPPITDPAACAAAYPYFGAPRIAAGGPTTHDNVRCEFAPLPETAPTDGSYGPAPFVLTQWDRLKAAFPEGVCDWSKPLPDRQPSIPWLTFKAGPGGQPMGDPPVSVPVP